MTALALTNFLVAFVRCDSIPGTDYRYLSAADGGAGM